MTMSKNLAQKRKDQERDKLRRAAMNRGTASPGQQMETARRERELEKHVAYLESLVYAEEV
jgi:hypothetical protein